MPSLKPLTLVSNLTPSAVIYIEFQAIQVPRNTVKYKKYPKVIKSTQKNLKVSKTTKQYTKNTQKYQKVPKSIQR